MGAVIDIVIQVMEMVEKEIPGDPDMQTDYWVEYFLAAHASAKKLGIEDTAITKDAYYIAILVADLMTEDKETKWEQ